MTDKRECYQCEGKGTTQPDEFSLRVRVCDRCNGEGWIAVDPWFVEVWERLGRLEAAAGIVTPEVQDAMAEVDLDSWIASGAPREEP